MRGIKRTFIGVVCLTSLVLSDGCEVLSDPDGAGPGLGDTVPVQQGDAVAGAALFVANGCNTCHGDDGSGGFGPSIRSAQVDALMAKLQNSAVGHVGGLFPDLTHEDLADLAAFLGDGDRNGPTAPSGSLHRVNMNNSGIFHVLGFDDPLTNCALCHGSDLTGSLPTPSCFSCHGPLWSGGGPPPSHTDVLSSGDVTGAHLPGRSNPSVNCTACHQNNLMGQFRVPSCYSCHGSEWDGPPDVPPTHTVFEDGVRHALGLASPAENCAGCHGSDLSGTSLIPSCFSCHGPLWSGGGPPPSHTDMLSSGDVTGAHLPGRDTPAANCASCHQNDLMGRFRVPSCYSCHGSEWDGPPDVPPTHTVDEDGVLHAVGLESPNNNCASCHGSDLSGTSLIPSCFSCHGPLWSGGGPPPSHIDMLSSGDVTGAHLPGRSNPSANCTACHQDDLMGQFRVPSCYSCHGQLWSGGGPPPSHTDALANGPIAGMHAPGRYSPATNCASCHRPDYFGTSLIPACWSCHGSLWDGPPDYPPTHTTVKHGFHHDPGLETPVNTCNACHGSDLLGTPLIPSCFTCHGDEWTSGSDR